MSSRSLDDLHPTLRKICLDHITECRRQGIQLVVYCTWRSPQEQQELYDQGRTGPGRVVTNARPGMSRHNAVHNGKPAATAYDCAPSIDGKITWSTDPDTLKVWQKIGAIGIQLGLEWGGSWKGHIVDMPHFQLPKSSI